MLNLDEDTLTRVAWYHYQEGITLTEIADRLNLSRSKATRILEKARTDGIVKFIINAPHANLLSLEGDLIKTFGLMDSVVVPSNPNPESVYQNIGKGGALYFNKIVKDKDLIGISWGKTLRQFSDNIIPRSNIHDVRFVSLAGGLTDETSVNPYNIGEKIASVFGGRCYYIHAPQVVDLNKGKNFYLKDKMNRKTLEMAKHARFSLIGIGSASFMNSTYFLTGFIDNQSMEIIRQKGGVGDILGQFFDINGEILDLELHQRTIAMSLKEIRKMPNIVGLAGGEYKVEAILGALRGKFIKVLITDETTAIAILNLVSKQNIIMENKK